MPALHRVEVFERETLRLGDLLRSSSGSAVRLGRTELDALLRFNDQTSQRYFQAGHDRITVGHHVGYVEVGRLAIEILPKADRAARASDTRPWRTGLLRMLRSATGMQLEAPDEASQRTGPSTLVELVAIRFLSEVERLLREGLARGYREDESNSTTFRGRLLFQQNLRENIARDERFYVRHVTFDADTLLNRILSETLRVLGIRRLSASTSSRVGACRASFPDVRGLRVTDATFERLPSGRSSARYHDALLLARLLLAEHAPELRAGGAPVFALLFDMEVLWERYVAAAFRKLASARWRIRTQLSRSFWQSGPSRRRVKPDIVVEDAATNRIVLIADTKWKVIEDCLPGNDDLKQMFVYNELFEAPRSVLLYPTVGDSRGGREGVYAVGGHECSTAHLGLLEGAVWSERGIERQVGELLRKLTHVRRPLPLSPAEIQTGDPRGATGAGA
jgi:5-methylcytosine-specific restriction enzyme subunit McrC